MIKLSYKAQSTEARNRLAPGWSATLAQSRSVTGGPSSSSYPNGHIDDLAAQVGNVLADVFGTELVWRTVEYCANYTPILSEHGCERLSHDQPIVFSRP